MRVISAARSIGRIQPPAGSTWEEALSTPAGERLAVLDFHTLTAKLLKVSPARIYVQRKPGTETSERARSKPGHWHRDNFAGPYISIVLGDSPTEFLLGAYSEEVFADELRHPELEASMELWQPEAGELVEGDRLTVHRRPCVGRGRRLFLLASVDESVEMRARAGARAKA